MLYTVASVGDLVVVQGRIPGVHIPCAAAAEPGMLCTAAPLGDLVVVQEWVMGLHIACAIAAGLVFRLLVLRKP